MLENEFRRFGSASVIFKGKRVFLYDTIFLPTKTRLLLEFHKTKSKWRQGVWLGVMTTDKIDVKLNVAGCTGPSLQLWWDTAPKKVEIETFTALGKINVYNTWDTGNGQCSSQLQGAGMLIEISDDGNYRYYRCNDGHPEPTFKHLEFSIEILSPYIPIQIP